MSELDAIFHLVEIGDMGEDATLELSSLQVVTLVEEFERAFGLTLRSSEITREAFASKSNIRALLRQRGVR